MNNKLFNNQKNYKKIGVAIITVMAIIITLGNIKLQSVSNYKSQQQSLADENIVINEKQNSDITVNADSIGIGVEEVSTECIISESNASKIDISDNNMEQNSIKNLENEAHNSTIIDNTVSNNSGNNAINGELDSLSSDSEMLTCTIEIRCDTISNDLSKWTNEIKSNSHIVPVDGTILKITTTTIKNGSTAYDVLMNETKKKDIKLQTSYSMAFNTIYVESINEISEKDAGGSSGWVYTVNNVTVSYGISTYKVKAGDHIKLLYTCNGGEDVKQYVK